MHASGWLYLTEQASVTLCLLWSLGLSAHLQLHPGRLLLTAALTALACLSGSAAPLIVRLLLLTCSLLPAPLLAFPGLPRRLLPRCILTLLLLTLTASGLFRLMTPLPAVLAVLLVCGGLRLLPAAAPVQEPLPRLATADIRCGAHHVSLTALIDSGNLLRDALTGLPVIVISRRCAARLIPLPLDGSLAPGMRLIPVRTISGTALMTVFRPDQVCIFNRGGWQRAEALVGVSPDGYDGYQALLPASLLSAEADSHCPFISQGG